MTKYPNNPTAQFLGVLSPIYDLWFKLTRVWSLLVLSPKAKGRPNKWFVSWLSGRKTYLTESYFEMCGIQVYFPKRSKSNIYSYLLYIYIYIHSKCVSIYNHILRQIRYHCVSASGAPRMEHGPQTSVERNIALLRDLAVLGEGPILKFQVISDRFCNKEWRTNITWITKWRGYSLFLRF